MKVLQDMAIRAKRKKYPNIPERALPRPRYTDKTANGLTKAIIDFLRLSGWQCERVSVTGRYLDRSRKTQDILGRTRTVGSGKWIPTSGQRGSADISATINGRSVKIEVKIGRDKQSKAQVEYQQEVEASGGVYFIARGWKGFYDWYKSFIENCNGKQ